MVGAAQRQHDTLNAIVAAVDRLPWLRSLLVIGSLAEDDKADALSDIDLLVVVFPDAFDAAWAHREELHATGALCSWDQRADESSDVAAHRWLTPDLVLVEALMATPASGVRLADPWRLAAGDPAAPHELAHRPPIDRAEMSATQTHPVEAAYDELKAQVRRACSGASRLR
jgi:hypothetical protein